MPMSSIRVSEWIHVEGAHHTGRLAISENPPITAHMGAQEQRDLSRVYGCCRSPGTPSDAIAVAVASSGLSGLVGLYQNERFLWPDVRPCALPNRLRSRASLSRSYISASN